MSKDKKATISVQGVDVTILLKGQEDYISLTDIAKVRNQEEPFL